MARRPEVDVAVVTWNTAELTADALGRLLGPDQGVDLRVLVHDNASQDGTVDLLRRRVPAAEVEAGSENLGFARGVNRILRRSRAPWIFLMNSDAWPVEGAIARLVAAAEERPRAAAIAPRLERPDGSLEHSTHPFPSLGVAAATAFLPRRMPRRRAEAMMLNGAWMHDRSREVDWAVGAALLIRRAALDDIGPFDESFFMYVEDLEWCWRARRRGWEIWFEPAAVVRHVGNASGRMRFGERRTQAYLANTYRFYRREHRALDAAAFRGLNLIGASLRYARARLARDANRERYWRAHLDAHLHPPRRAERAG